MLLFSQKPEHQYSLIAGKAELQGLLLLHLGVEAEVLLALTWEQIVGLELLRNVEYEGVGSSGLLQERCEEWRGRVRGSHAGTCATEPLPTGEVFRVNRGVTVRTRQRQNR